MPGPTKTALFGSGSMYVIAGGKPMKVGCLQNIELDYSVDIKELYGQNKFPEAIAQGQAKLSGKAKTGFLDLGLFNALFIGGTVDTTGYEKLQELEGKTVPNQAPYTATATNAVAFTGDMGAFYTLTGVQLIQVAAGSEAAGKYSVNLATGVYTFSSLDAGLGVLINYTFNSTNGSQAPIVNGTTGNQTVFQLFLQEGYTGSSGRTNNTIRLTNCVASKINFPFKNDDFAVQDLEFMCFADPLTGKVMNVGMGQ